MLRSMVLRMLRCGVAIVVSVCLVATGTPASGAPGGRASAQAAARCAAADPQPSPRPVDEHFLRDAIPAPSEAVEPPDTTGDDEFTLPEEKDKKKLYREIAVFIVASAFVAYFIIKVFIEKDPPASEKPGGKPVPLPQ
jgi:hypothetical protein